MKIKIVTIMVLIVLFTVFVSQNTKVIPINVFFWSVQMSTIVLISLTGLVGVILGFIIAKLFRTQPKKKTKFKEEDSTPSFNNK